MEKARYYLEQCVPELKDLQEKSIFDRNEIGKIMHRRTEFEQRICARGPQKVDFIRYAEYEMRVEELRKRRAKRLRITGRPTISDWAGLRRIFFIFDRATRRFQGERGLWIKYINYAKSEHAPKVLARVFADVLQMHPSDPSFWIMAAQHEFDVNANMDAARKLMQRGLRFNKDSSKFWLEYARLELKYVHKLTARREVLGINGSEQDDGVLDEHMNPDLSGTIHLPVEKDEIAVEKRGVLSNLSANPALSGRIALAIYNAAMEEIPTIELASSFYKIIIEFENIPAHEKLLEHIRGDVATRFPESVSGEYLVVSSG